MSARDELERLYGNKGEKKPGKGIASTVAGVASRAVSTAENMVARTTGNSSRKTARQTLDEMYGSPDAPGAVRARSAREGREKFNRENDPHRNIARRVVGAPEQAPNDQWREDWLEEFYVRYNTDQDSAYSYAKEVNNHLASQRLAADQERIKKTAARNPVASTIAGVVASPFALLDAADKGLAYLATGELPQRDRVTLGDVSRVMTSGVAEGLNEKYGTLDEDIPVIGGKGWGDVYSLGNSALQSLVLGNTIGSGATLATFFGQGASSGMDEIKARGGSDGQAILYGLASGAAEVLMEKVPLDNLLKGGDAVRFTLKSWGKNVAKQAAMEGAEEAMTSVANALADQFIMGDKSNFYVRVQEYVDQGMDEEEAKNKAWWDYAEDVIFDFAGGALSGAGSMATQTALPTALANYQTSRTSAPESDAVLIEQALAADEGTKPHKLAQKYQGAEKLTGGQINDLAAAYQEYEAGKQYERAAEKAGEKLEELDAEDGTVATAIAKTLTGKDLNRRERRALERSEKGKRVLQQMQSDRSWQQEEDGAENAQVDKVSPNVPDTNAGSIEPQAVDMAVEDVDDGDFAASESGKAVFDGKPVDIKGIADTKGDMTLELTDGRTVKASEVLYATEGEALVYEAVASLGAPADIGNILVKNYRDGAEHVEAEDYAMGMSLAFNHGRHNLPKDQMTANPYIAKLTDVQRNSAYVLGQRFGGRQVASQEAVARRTRFGQRFQELGRPLTGRVHYDGDVRKLNVRQRASISALEKVADALGVQIHLFESQVDENGVRQGENGWYNTKTGDIGIDIHAGISGEDTMLFTAAHELTHFIKQWSPAKFKVLANFLMEQYGQKGVSVEELVERQQAKALRGGREPSFDEAFEEMVADSMETMLADGNVLEKLTKLGKQDRTLLEKLRDGLQELIQKIRQVYKGLKPDSREGRYVAEMKDSLERMHELFTEALEEAGQNFQAAEQAKAEAAASSQRNAEGAAQVQRRTENVHSEATKANETEQEDFDWEEFDANLEFSRRDNEKTAREGGKRYSLREIVGPSGVSYGIGVYLDSTFLENLSEDERVALVKEYIKEVGGSTFTAFDNNNKAVDILLVDSKRKFKNKNGKNVPVLKDMMNYLNNDVKQEAIALIDELVQASTYRGTEPATHPHGWLDGNGANDWDVWTTYIQDKKNTVWEAKLRIANSVNGEKILYDIFPINKVEEAQTMGTATTNGIVSRPAHGVNTKLSARDSEGRELSQGQQEYFKDSKVRDEDGRLMVMYHGTPNGSHTTFRPGAYFTPNREYADKYQNPNASMLSSKKNADAPKTYEVYLNITKPFDTRNPKERKIFMEEYYRQWGTGAPLADSGLPDWTDGMDLQEFIEEMGYDYDGLILDEGATGGYGMEVQSRGLSYVTFNSEQAKNVDNKAPTKNPDIRFSARDYAYDTLVSKPDMAVTTVDGAIPNDRADVVALAKKNAAKVGRVDPKTGSVSVHVDDIDTDVLLGRDGLKHGLRRTKNPQNDANYIVTVKAGEIIKNSIKINEANPKNQSASGAYVLIGAARNANGDLYIVRSIVNQFSNELDSMDVLYAINAKKEPAALNAPLSAGNPALGTDSTISIAELLDHVNQYFPDILPEDVLKHYSYEARPDGDFGENVLYSDRDPAEVKLNQALRKENAAQAKEIEYLRELVKLQGKVTNGTKFTQTSVRRIAKELMQKAGAKGNYLELAEILNGVYESIASAKEDQELNWGEGDEAAQWLMEHIEVKPDRGEYANDILRDLRTRRISLNEGQMAEVRSRYGSYNDFRKTMFGSFILSKDGTPLDSVWQELASQYPGTFDADTGDADMPLKLAEIVEGLRETDLSAMEFEMQRDGLLEELRQNVYDGYWRVSTLHTVADKYQKEIDKLKERHQDTVKKLDEARKERDKANRLRIDSVRELRESKKKAVETLRKNYKDARKKSVEGRNKTAMRHRIQRVVKELNDLLLKPDKKHHVPEGLRKVVAEALDVVNMDNLDADTKIEAINDELAELYTERVIANKAGDVKEAAQLLGKIRQLEQRRAKIEEAGGRLDEKLKALHAAYEEIKESADPEIANAYNEGLSSYILMKAGMIGDTPLKNMSMEQLSDVYDMYTMVLTTIRDSNKKLTDALNAGHRESAEAAEREITGNGKRNRLGIELIEQLRKFGINNLKPVYFFEYLNSKTFRKLYQGLMQGQSQFGRNMAEARDFQLEQTKKYGAKNWDKEKTWTFRAASGDKFSLNLEQIMSLYAYSKRDQAREHIRKGGIVIDPETKIQEVVELAEGKFKVKLKGKSQDATAYNIDDVTLDEIIGKLTAKQRAYVDAMQDYLSDTMGAKGNEVSMKLYGIKLFKEKHYFPLRSAQEYSVRAKEQAEQTARLKNAGFTKATKPHAANPILLTEFFDAWADHVQDMSQYHAMTLPIEDLYRVYNYSRNGDGVKGSKAVVAAIQNAFGPQATGYIDQLMKDMNGKKFLDSAGEFQSKLVSRFKKGAVFMSASVLFQQSSSVARALAEIDVKYLSPVSYVESLTVYPRQLLGLINKNASRSHDKLWAELKEYAPIAVIKEMGYFDMNMGKSGRDYLNGQEYGSFREKLQGFIQDSSYRDEVLSRGPALADELAWCDIWRAVKREQHAKHPKLKVSSKEFLELCGQRFTEIIDKTQVYDSVLSRSANMRSGSELMKMATSFMAEPTVTANMLANALLEGKRGHKGKAVRIVGSVIAANIINAALAALVYAGRDDDEDKEYWEKYLGHLTGEVIDSMNPPTYIPIVQDVLSVCAGWDVERADMAVVSDLVNAIKKLSSDKATTWEKTRDMLGAASQLLNLPVKNLLRDGEALWRFVNDAFDEQESTAAGIGYAVRAELPEWIPGGGVVTNGDQLYESILKGDKAHEERVRARFKDKEGNIDEGKARNALRKAIRENDSRIHEAAVYLNEGQLLEYYNIVEEIVGEGFFHKDDVVSAIGSEASSLQEDGGGKETATRHKSAFKAEHFAIAAADGDSQMMNIIKADLVLTAQANGKTEAEAEKAAASSIRGAVKEAFVDGDTLSEAQAQKALTGWCDATKEEAEGIVEEWNFEKRNGYALSELKDALAGGEVTADEAEDILVSYGGKTREEAELTVQAYRWRSEHPEYEDLSDDKIDRYIRFCKGAGISIQDFYEANEQVSEIKEAGGAQKENVVRYIRSLPLSKQQKWALWYAVKTTSWKDNVSF